MVAVTNNTDSVILFRVCLDRMELQEVKVLKGFEGKVTSLNWLRKGRRFLASFHSSGVVHEVEVEN